MTTVQVRRDEKGVCGLKVRGHSGYAEEGSDIVCAAASFLITTCANALENVAGVIPHQRVDEKRVTIEVLLPGNLSAQQDHDARIIFATALQGFEDIAAEYPQYLHIL